MTEPVSRDTYIELRDVIQEFVANHDASDMERFKANIANVDDHWIDATVATLPASEYLAPALPSATPQTRALATAFEKHRNALKWEQSYTAADQLVGSDMLNGYGFVEVIGKNGPCVSNAVRSGIGVWGPNIDYPVHNHEAEEIYVPLAGHAGFTLDSSPYETRQPGDVIHVPSNQRHGFRTTTEPFVVFYIWQAGDLRQKSTFG